MTTGINHITLSVSDITRSLRFYVDTLGLQAVARWSTGAYLLSGQTWVALAQEVGIARAVRPDYTHIAFGVPLSRFAAAQASLTAAGVSFWKQNTSEGDSLYFLDPDSHKLEIHATELADRIASMREHPWDDIEFLEAAAPAAERVVHVCDVHDFTHVSMELGDRVEEFLDRFYSELSDLAVSRGGALFEYLGDCMYFVYPSGSEISAVEAAIDMRHGYDNMLRQYAIGTESELENGISAGVVTIRTVGHPSHRVRRIYGTAVGEAMALGCHRGVAITSAVKDRVAARYTTRRIPDVPGKWTNEALSAWEIALSI